MCDDVIRNIPYYGVANGNSAQALRASAVISVRIELRVIRKVPFQHCTAPVSGSPHDNIFNMPLKVSSKIALSRRPLFGKINITIRMRIVHFRKCRYLSKVQVKGSAINIPFRTLVIQNGNWVLWMIAVMIKNHNLGVDPERSERRT